ncbi:MAG TPA: VOC family protein [Chloroflexota bacterium]|jgi:catechol 2,3-dioxygenase-like lactoylglutathione lyase family enzyme
MDTRNGHGSQGMADHARDDAAHQAAARADDARQAAARDDDARQAAALSDLVDLLNAGATAAAAARVARADDGDQRRLLTVARLLSVQPDLAVIERTSARLRPWATAARPGPARLTAAADGAGEASAPALPRDGEPDRPTAPAPRSVLEVTGLDHVALPVSDLERAVAFYRGVLGLPIVNESRTPPPPTTPHVDFAAGDARLLVYQALGRGEAAPRKALGGELQFPHVALRLPAAAPVLARLRANGHPFDGPIPSGAGQAAVHLWDPDGNQVDLIVPWPEPAAR